MCTERACKCQGDQKRLRGSSTVERLVAVGGEKKQSLLPGAADNRDHHLCGQRKGRLWVIR